MIGPEFQRSPDTSIAGFPRPEKRGGFTHFYRLVAQQMLDEQFTQDLKRWWISPEHWFSQNIEAHKKLYSPERESSYSVPAGEESLLMQHRAELLSYIDGRTLVFWGAGRKEATLTNWGNEMNPSSQKAIVIDVEPTYMDEMADQIQAPTNLIGVHALFQSFLQSDYQAVLRQAIGEQSAVHVCLGTTIGNFRQEEMFGIFQKNLKPRDRLLLGFQLENDPEKIFREYAEDEYFTPMVKLPLFVSLEEQGAGSCSLRYNYEAHQVEYWFTFGKDHVVDQEKGLVFQEGDEIEIFRSKKYHLTELLQELKGYGFEYEIDFQKDDHCLLLLRKV